MGLLTDIPSYAVNRCALVIPASRLSSTPELRVVLLGKTGSGKSSLANTLLGQDLFQAEPSFGSVTFKCQWKETYRFGPRLQFVDTPGVSDTDRPEDEVLTEIGKSIALAAPGPHVVLMVLRSDVRFTSEEYGAYQALKKLFGEGIREHMILVFTRQDCGDTQAERDKNMADLIKTGPPTLQEIVAEAEGRYYNVNNKGTKNKREPDLEVFLREQQAKTIVEAMQKIAAQNGGKPFTSSLCQTVNQQVEAVVQKRLDTHQDVSHEAALTHVKQDIVQDRAVPGFFEKLKKVVRDALLPVVQFVQAAATKVAKAAVENVSRCSVM